LEGGLTHVHADENVRISKRTNRPVRKYVWKVKVESSGPSSSVDLEDPIQSVAFINSVTNLVHKIAVAANVSGSRAGKDKHIPLRSHMRSHDDPVPFTTAAEGISSNPPTAIGEGGASKSCSTPRTLVKPQWTGRTGKSVDHDSSTSLISTKRKGIHQGSRSTSTRKHTKVGQHVTFIDDNEEVDPVTLRHLSKFTPPKTRSKHVITSPLAEDLRRSLFGIYTRSTSSSSVKLPTHSTGNFPRLSFFSLTLRLSIMTFTCPCHWIVQFCELHSELCLLLVYR
jgi:hypothetical protein